ncbi:DUF6745 domain-containing protein [Solwaraspora sp. WMMA2101]|uniref:DUF6745 domain-containing protein n=1 Tax=Solwaraspora sp. WMMA2101 TaxID=3404124 RepID=UPI003B9614F8
MTAPTRRDAAGTISTISVGSTTSTTSAGYAERALARWWAAEPIRREWLDHGLDTAPADRPATEDIVARLYARRRRQRPRFRWVDSPHEALSLVAGLPTHDMLHRWVTGRPPPGVPPLVSDLVAGWSRLRTALDDGAGHPDLTPPPQSRGRSGGRGGGRRSADRRADAGGADPPGTRWPVLPPAEAFAAGVPLRVVLRQGICAALRVSLVDGFVLPVRAALAASGRPVPSAWYGQQDAYWVAYYDALRRLGLAHYRRADEAQLDEWATLARQAGWWWPGERTCVLVDRPVVLRTDPVPGGWHDERRLARDGAAPIRYRDGWSPSLRAVPG